MSKSQKIDKIFLISIFLLTITGFFIFTSASLGLLARDGVSFESVALRQTISLILGAFGFFIMSKIHYRNLRKYAFYIFVFSILLNLLLFIPSFTLNHGGASRWIDLRIITFQPSEFLKITFIIYFAAWLSGIKEKTHGFLMGILPYLIIVGALGFLLFKQSDLDTLIVIAITGIIMLFASGGRKRDILVIGIILIIAISFYAYIKPYVKQRLITFINPTLDTRGSAYQIQQSLIAIGSGQINGRGFGQSIQKFNYLPEPIGDSIFAVGAEEFGFIGCIGLIILFLLFLFRSMKIAVRAQDSFGGLVVIGIAILIIIESFMNISSMLGIIPLSGMPLLFVSQGGTALIVILTATGIIANISKYQKL